MKVIFPLLVWLLQWCSGVSVQLFPRPRGTLKQLQFLSPSLSTSSLSNLRPLHSIQQRTVQSIPFPSSSPSRAVDPPPPPPDVPETVDVVVVGAGLCGSTAAFYLDKQGFRVILAEEAPEVGGCVNTKQKDGFLWEEGANSFQPTPKLLKVAKDIGILDELLLANASLPRFIFWKNEMKSLPMSVRALWETDLLSWRGKWRLLRGLLGGVRARRRQEESIEEFTTRHFGEEVFTRMVDPFVSGVYAGSPQHLSVDATLGKVSRLEDPGVTRSVLEGALVNNFQAKLSSQSSTQNEVEESTLPSVPPGSLGSFKRGLQSVPLQVETVLGSRCRVLHSLRRLQPHRAPGAATGGWLSTFRVGGDGDSPVTYKTFFSRSVLLTTPAYTTAKLLGERAEDLSASPLRGKQEEEEQQEGKRASEKGMVSEERQDSEKERVGLADMALLPPSSPGMAALRDIEYPPVVGVYLAYPSSSFQQPMHGFGHLIPRANHVRSLGTIWGSSLFPNRAPAGYSLLLTFIGGAQDKEILTLSRDEIVQQVDKDLRTTVLKEGAPPPRVLSVKTWTRGIPQYNKGYLQGLAAIRKAVESTPGIFLGGNYISGVSVGDCIDYGATIATNISSYLLKSRFS